jgi:hypothetical protein
MGSAMVPLMLNLPFITAIFSAFDLESALKKLLFVKYKVLISGLATVPLIV